MCVCVCVCVCVCNYLCIDTYINTRIKEKKIEDVGERKKRLFP